MTKFYNLLFSKQQEKEAVPSNEVIAGWAHKIVCLLFPELSKVVYKSASEIESEFNDLRRELVQIIDATTACSDCNTENVAKKFFDELPELHRVLTTDIHSILNGDPAAKTEFEVIRAYPGFFALCFYRIAHELVNLDVSLLPRILTEFA
ncbi:MAG: serine acetyltransferase, partial [Gemmatimonadaceae bacterium]|nr:serine acetyltransferase [Chitinophagaceae bacterium]